MVSQFISPHAVPLLGSVDFDFPEGTHAIGRLDQHSEGLLLLTTDKKVTRLIFLSNTPHKRTYLVMVQNEVTAESLQRLKQGIPIRVKGGEYYTAIPTEISIEPHPLKYYACATDHREKYPHTWLRITLTEGKYHQVRKMMLAVKHRCLRLIRLNIEGLTVEGIAPGKVKEISKDDFYKYARIATDVS